MARKTVQNDLTSPERMALVNKDNISLTKEFLRYLKSINRAQTTINAYEYDLNIFWCYVLDNCKNKSFSKITKRDLISYQCWLGEENKNSPARIRRLKATISSLSNYVENILDEEDEFSGFRSIIKRVENPINEPVREKTVLSEEQVISFLDGLVEKKQYQKACAAALAVYSGSRKSELLCFKPEFFVDENIIYGSLYKTPEKIKTKGRGAGKFIYRLVLVNNFKKYFDLWMEERKTLGVDCDDLFVKKDDSGKWIPANIGTLNSWASTFSRMLGVDFYWHALRHYYTTYLSLAGLPDDVIANIIGWGSTAMVKTYVDTEAEDSFGKYFNNGNIVAVKKTELSDL